MILMRRLKNKDDGYHFHDHNNDNVVIEMIVMMEIKMMPMLVLHAKLKFKMVITAPAYNSKLPRDLNLHI